MDIEVRNEKKKPQLKDHELKALIQKSQDGDQQARDTIVQSNMRLVWSVVQRFLNRGYEPGRFISNWMYWALKIGR